MSFAGTFEHNLDAKNRLSVPTRMRASLSGPLVLAQDTERCVTIWAKETYDANSEKALAGLNPLGERAQLIKRFRGANSVEAELDSSGRVNVPGFLIDWAGLQREVAVIGAGDHAEIWDRATWNEQNTSLAEQMKNLARELDARD
ncbi:MAG TPA: division/cell wall cluster transcriptional repressor MraZ [Baekduia sp.]|nr:division/cell wall cluster transcriptional repressor MraZ [Baekduia sp.]